MKIVGAPCMAFTSLFVPKLGLSSTTNFSKSISSYRQFYEGSSRVASRTADLHRRACMTMTDAGEAAVETQSVSAYTDIVRKSPTERYSQIVIHNDVVYLSGVVAASADKNVANQTRDILEKIDDLLVEAGTHKSRLLTASVRLADISKAADMNTAWDKWLDAENKPTRATVESRLLRDELAVEIQVTAALPSRARVLRTADAAAAVGPYNQGVVVNNGTVYVSGCIGLSATSGAMVGTTVEEQCHQALSNLSAVLTEAGCSANDIVKTMILIDDMKDFGTVNDIYAEFFSGGPVPARSCFAAKQLPKGALIEIEAIAIKERV